MKRMRTAVIAAVLLGVLAVGAGAASGIQQIIADLRPDITVEVDGMARTMTDKNGKTVYPISYEGTTYLPVRALGEILGQTVEWDSATQTVIMTEKVLEPAALYPTVDDLEKGMTRSEKAIDGLTPAATYVERAKQYAALVADLDDLRAGTDALVEETNSDFSAGKLTLAEFNDLNSRLGKVDVRLKDAYADLEAKTIADETGKLTAYEISANSLTELEAAMTELEKAIEAFKPAPTTVEQAQSYAALSLRLENLYEQISSRYKTINDDYMQNRITTSEYNSLNSRANSLDTRAKDARADLEEKNAASGTAYQVADAVIKELDSRTATLEQEVKDLKPSQDYIERVKEYLAIEEKFSALSQDISSEYSIINDDLRQGRTSYSEYNSLNSRLGGLDVRVKNARADLKEKVFQGDWEDPDDGSTTPGGSYDGYWDQINNLANRIADLVKKIWTDGWKNGQQLVQDLKALDEECGKLEDALENAYKQSKLSKSEYRSLESLLDQAEDRADSAMDYLEDLLDWDDDDDDDDDWWNYRGHWNYGHDNGWHRGWYKDMWDDWDDWDD